MMGFISSKNLLSLEFTLLSKDFSLTSLYWSLTNLTYACTTLCFLSIFLFLGDKQHTQHFWINRETSRAHKAQQFRYKTHLLINRLQKWESISLRAKKHKEEMLLTLDCLFHPYTQGQSRLVWERKWVLPGSSETLYSFTNIAAGREPRGLFDTEDCFLNTPHTSQIPNSTLFTKNGTVGATTKKTTKLGERAIFHYTVDSTSA